MIWAYRKPRGVGCDVGDGGCASGAMLEKAEYKRRQAPPGVKITRRIWGATGVTRLPINTANGQGDRHFLYFLVLLRAKLYLCRSLPSGQDP